MHSPSTPTTISVRFLFLIPLMLHTPFACVRPLLELTGFDSEARVNGAPISLSTDILFAVRVSCYAKFAAVAAQLAPALFDMVKKLRVTVSGGLCCGVEPPKKWATLARVGASRACIIVSRLPLVHFEECSRHASTLLLSLVDSA